AADSLLYRGPARARDGVARRHPMPALLDVRARPLRARLYSRHLQPARSAHRHVRNQRDCAPPDVGHRLCPHHAVCLRVMTPGARASAAIEVLADIEARKRPAADALKDWGLAHRFAGSGDRAAIGNLVFDVLRKRASAAYAMGEDSPRALVLRTLHTSWGKTPGEVAALADGSRHAPEPLSEAERAGLARDIAADAPAHIRGDYPMWLQPLFDKAFGDRAAEEGAALAARAPVDLRVNTLKATREKVLKALSRFKPMPTPLSPLGVRILQAPGPGRSPHVEAEAGHGKGWYEVQDEASQVAALLTGAGPKAQTIDLCAGAGGKTLA